MDIYQKRKLSYLKSLKAAIKQLFSNFSFMISNDKKVRKMSQIREIMIPFDFSNW